MSETRINLIVAVGAYIPGKGYPIGKDGTIPWHNKADMKWFRETTMGHTVIMGHNTYKSIGKPLSGRYNIVVTSKRAYTGDEDNIEFQPTLEDAIDTAIDRSGKNDSDIFIIGGESIYRETLEFDYADRLYIDFLDEQVPDADKFFPLEEVITEKKNWYPLVWNLTINHNKAHAKIIECRKPKRDGYDYLYTNLIDTLIQYGEHKDTRAGATRSMFGLYLNWKLHNGLPVLTSKKMYTKGVLHELIWFLSGNTNIKYLVDNNVHIWDDDAYRFYLEIMRGNFDIDGDESYSIEKGDYFTINKGVLSKEDFLKGVAEGWRILNLSNIVKGTYVFGDLNNVYGHQWRKWGGHDQIQEVIDKLRTNPDDRRMIVSAWNVEDIPTMALPPCHYTFQFYTNKMTEAERWDYLERHLLNGDDMDAYYSLMRSRRPEYKEGELSHVLDRYNVPVRKLSCMFNMRSIDCILGLPFNMLSYAVLTHMIAKCVNMDVGELIVNGGDCHIYENQIAIYEKEQKDRRNAPYPLPVLRLNPDVRNIDDFRYEDILVEDYKSYPAVKYPLSVGL